MALTKIVDNVVIELTAEEIAEVEARVAAADLDFSGVRGERNGLLSNSDWTQLDDAPLTDEQQEAWERYRQELRDLPQTYTRVSEVVWPTPPE
jgi:hypothetical protein